MKTKVKKFYAGRRIVGVFMVAAVLMVTAVGWVVLQAGEHPYSVPTQSKLAYVDGNDATDQVANFYRQYIALADEPDRQQKLIPVYGNENLTFYSRYYRHGFDPITCSTLRVSDVSASVIAPGPVAHVKAMLTYIDHSSAQIEAVVVLSDRLAIDSLTCPGAKGNLPPAES
jgi:hypothetical protein